MSFDDLPMSAAWVHEEARAGFETVFVRATTRGWRFSGHTVAVEDHRPWTVHYEITVDRRWRTRAAEVRGWNNAGTWSVSLRHDGAGRWTVNGEAVPELDGCVDVDLESSACTNTLPVHRLAQDAGPRDAPAAYVHVDGGVDRLDQTYRRITGDDASTSYYEYEAPRFDFSARLEYDRHGLVVRYPGIARRSL